MKDTFAVFVLFPEEGNGTYHLYPILEWNCLMSKVFTLDFISFLFVSQLCYSACFQLCVDNFQDPCPFCHATFQLASNPCHSRNLRSTLRRRSRISKVHGTYAILRNFRSNTYCQVFSAQVCQIFSARDCPLDNMDQLR